MKYQALSLEDVLLINSIRPNKHTAKMSFFQNFIPCFKNSEDPDQLASEETN